MSCNLCIFAGRCITNYWFPLRTFRRFFSESYYDVLKVSPTCSTKEIREAFLLLSKQTHPDKHLNDPSMHEKFVRLNEAYSTLINPSSRRSYDLTLYNERKLNPPYDKPYSSHIHTRRRAYDKYQPPKSSQNAYSGYYKDPFSWDFKDKNETGRYSFGLNGAKKISNTAIVGLLLTVTVFGVIIQVLAIRHSFLSNQEQMLKRSHSYSLIHKLAREKAKLYGNAHQLEVLKKNLAGSYDTEDIDKNIPDNKTEEEDASGNSSNIQDPMKAVNKGKEQMLRPNEGQHGKPRGGRVGECAIHGAPGQCAVHRKLNNEPNQIISPESRTVNGPVDACRKCNKCGHKIY